MLFSTNANFYKHNIVVMNLQPYFPPFDVRILSLSSSNTCSSQSVDIDGRLAQNDSARMMTFITWSVKSGWSHPGSWEAYI